MQTPRPKRSRHLLLELVIAASAVAFPVPAPAVSFIRGDADGNGRVEISDAVGILNFLFLGFPGGDCLEAMEADDNGGLNITDAVFLLRHLFEGGREPPPPFPDCGQDPTPGNYECHFDAACEPVRDPVTFRTEDGLHLTGYLLAGGPPGAPGVILVHQFREDAEQWGESPEELARQGYRVLAFNLRGHGDSAPYGGSLEALLTDPDGAPRDVAAAVKFLAGPGDGYANKDRLAIVGTSIGANLAVVASMKKLAKTFVAISPRRSPIESLAGEPAAGMESVLYLVSENDGAADVRALHDLTAEPRGIHVYEGVADHGVEILRRHPDAEAMIISWLAERL